MLDSVSSIAGYATAMSQAKLAQQVQIATLKMANEQIDQQGQAALQLIQSAAPAAASPGEPGALFDARA